MNKKIVASVLVVAGAFLLGGVSVKAISYLPWTKNIYSVSRAEESICNGVSCVPPTVSVFDDADNKCYVVAYDSSTKYAISCVKR